MKIIIGIFIGLSCLIPGVSGGTIAISLGVYSDILNALTHLIQQPIKSIKILSPFLIGVVVSFVGFIPIMRYLIIFHEDLTKLFFLGLIFGGVPALLNNLSHKRITGAMGLLVIISCLVILLYEKISLIYYYEVNTTFIVLFLIGLIMSFTLIIPGLSGSVILMTLGVYELLLHHLTTLISSLYHFDLISLSSSFLIVLPFVMGVSLGVIMFSKCIKILSEKYTSSFICVILGIVSANIVFLVGTLEKMPIYYMFSFILGYVISFNTGGK